MIKIYLFSALLIVGFVFSYPFLQSEFGFAMVYREVVISGFLLLIFIIPLYWRAIAKQEEKERVQENRVKQPWE